MDSSSESQQEPDKTLVTIVHSFSIISDLIAPKLPVGIGEMNRFLC